MKKLQMAFMKQIPVQNCKITFFVFFVTLLQDTYLKTYLKILRKVDKGVKRQFGDYR